MCEKYEVDRHYGTAEDSQCCYKCKWNGRKGKCLMHGVPDESISENPLMVWQGMYMLKVAAGIVAFMAVWHLVSVLLDKIFT